MPDSELSPDREAVITLVADRLMAAAASGTPITPVRADLGETAVALAYAVQQVLTAVRLATGARIAGRKIGLTSPAVQRQLGVDQPDFGVLFDDMAVPDGGTVDSSGLIQPKAEAEIAFVLKSDLAVPASAPDGPITEAERSRTVAAVDYAVAALEIVDSRISGWDIGITDTVADNASSARYVLGGTRVALTDFSPADVTMVLYKNGEQASSGTGAACLGDPVNALIWLARTAASFGSPLRAGDVILSGALGAMVTAEPGSRITAELSTLGRVSVTFSE